MAKLGRCENCLAPKGKDCPNWVAESWGVWETNVVTGEQRLVTGCFPRVMLRLMEFVVRTNNSAAAAVESNRNETAAGLQRVAHAIGSTMPRLIERR